MNIKGNNISLRAVEPEDIDLLYCWENDTTLWSVSGTVAPFSRYTLSLFIEAQREDIFTSRQMRLMICLEDGSVVGALDMFEFDPQHRRAGLGIVVAREHQGKGYASEAITLFEGYATEFLAMNQLWCNVEVDNLPSVRLFESLGYKRVGIKQNWNFTPSGWKDESLYQKLLQS